MVERWRLHPIGVERPKMLAALATLLLLSIPILGDSAAAVEENPDVDTSAVYEYRADPDSNAINVTITLKVTADKPNSSTAGGYFQYYFEGYGLVLPKSASDLSITDGSGRDLNYEIEFEDDLFQTVVFGFRRNIFFRQTATVVLNYNLVEDRDDEYSLVRANDAYIGLEVWTDPTLEEAEVNVITPPGFVRVNAGPDIIASQRFITEVREEEIVHSAVDVDPEEFWAVLSMHRPDELVEESFDVDGFEVNLRSWPGDQEWSEEAEESIQEGLPLLIDSVGLEWPLEDELTITESFDPTLAGYGGWYDSETEEISIGDDFDDHLMLHELSHIWFGDELFSERWITEGLADTYAADVVEAMGEDRPEPEKVSLLDSAALSLKTWSPFLRKPEVEQWAYPASWTVTEALVDELGKDTLDDVIEAAANDQISYLGDGDPEDSVAAGNWKRYLDLLENRGGGTNEEVQELFLDWVVVDGDKRVIETRNENRERYFALVERGDGWAAPIGLRTVMSQWVFSSAEEHMDGAEAVLDRRDDVIETLGPIDVELPDSLESGYEGAHDSAMENVNELFDEAELAADQLRSSHDGYTAATGVFEQIGAVGHDFDAAFAIVVDEFGEGNFEAVGVGTEVFDAKVDDLARSGMIRSGVGAGVVLLLGGGLIRLLMRRRRKHRSRREPPAPPTPSAPPVPPTPPAPPDPTFA